MTSTRRDFAALTLGLPLALTLAGPGCAQARPALVIAAGGGGPDCAAGTRLAYDLAIQGGADVIAADFVPTQDGALVALPGPELSAATDIAARPAFADRRRSLFIDGAEQQGWFVQDFTLAEIKSLSRAGTGAKRHGGSRPQGADAILTFDDLVSTARAGSVRTARVIGVQAGLLHPAFFAGLDLALEPRLASAIRLAGYNAPAAAMVVASDDRGALKSIGGLTRARRALRLHAAGPPTPEALAGIRPLAEIIAPDFPLLLDLANAKLTPPTALIADAHAAGLAVQAWTAIDAGPFPPPPFRPGDARRLLAALFAAGADAVAGDQAAPIARARG